VRDVGSATGGLLPARKPHPGPLYAAIDLGTHNSRMLIAAAVGRYRFRIVDAYSRGVRLGEGLGVNGALGEAAMGRAIDALAVCAARIRRGPVARVRAVATQACRQAANAGAFLARAAAETGIELTPITAAEEAELTLAGCAQLVDPSCPHVLMFDIGGGSTEVMWVKQAQGLAPRIRAMASLPYGVVSFAERYGSDRVSPDRYRAMVAAVDADLVRFDKENGIGEALAGGGGVQMLGSSGTVTTLAAVHLRLPHYQRSRVDGVVVDFDSMARVSRRLAAADLAGRAAIPCIGSDRADLVVAGCAILDAICRRWPVGRLTVADRGIREGLLLAMMDEDRRAEGGLRATGGGRGA
jgi:exopolyphosphatase / guanosine-5'-triphosphate,3'-diphosphate pyrophosphatase